MPVTGTESAPSLYLRGDLSEDELAEIYLRFKRENLLPSLFYEGIPSLTKFLALHRQPDSTWRACCRCPIVGSPEEIMGMGWVYNIKRLPKHSRANVAEGFFRGTPIDTCLQFGELLLDCAFNVVNLDILFGSTPYPNRAACIYLLKFGFTKIGICPEYTVWEGNPCPAVLSYLTKQEWVKSRGNAR